MDKVFIRMTVSIVNFIFHIPIAILIYFMHLSNYPQLKMTKGLNTTQTTPTAALKMIFLSITKTKTLTRMKVKISMKTSELKIPPL